MTREFTIKEVASMAGVSKNAIRFRIRKINGFSTKYMRIGKGNTRLISSDGAKRLLGKSIGKQIAPASYQIINRQLLNEIDDLKSQRDTSQAEVTRLTALLSHEQELNLTAQKEVKRLRGTVKHGWFWRLFH